jgi:isochorismate synthase
VTASNGDLEAWHDSVRALTARIAAGRVDKVVLARRVRLEADSPFSVAAALQNLRDRYRDCTIFAVRRGSDCFLGATPELLVRQEGRRIHADCLAGSAARGANETEDAALGAALLADDKERREHALVTRGMLESLEGLCDRIEAPPAPSLRRMANVQHLHTPIDAEAGEASHVLDFVDRLHPTPATAGLPRARSLCLIRESEAFSRGWYAGPIGWLDAGGDGEFAVALRSALVRGKEALLYAGCGIVEGSDPDREYEESRMKLRAMAWALGSQS